MDLHVFLIPPAESARRKGPHDRIVMSSRVRLARNLKDAAFPGWAKKPERIRVLELIRPAIEALPEMKGAFSGTMDSLSTLDKQILVERHLISREHAAKSAGSGLVLNREETLCFMINEEDHLRMQALRPGLQLRQAWAAIDQADSALEKKLNYAFSPELGLPDRLPDQPRHRHPGQRHAAPARAGPGRADQPDHPIGQQARPGRARPLRRRHRGAGQCLPGVQPDDPGRIRGGHRRAAGEGPGPDHRARGKRPRRRLLEKKPKMVYNHIGRAYGILANAHSISSKETMNLLSLMRLGVDVGLFPGWTGPWWTSCSF